MRRIAGAPVADMDELPCRLPLDRKGDRHPEQIADQLIALANTGLDGIVLSCVNYHDEMRR
jgi:hypothetical protein